MEQGSRNHEVVPTPLIIQISGLRGGSGVHKSISTLAKANLIARQKNAKCTTQALPSRTFGLDLICYEDDGYRLTYGGLDYLAMHTHTKKSTVYSVGNQIGVGKESDIYVVASPGGIQHVLKIHRLGRISFRSVKTNRDYLRNRSSGSWMYMSRLAALKEFTFMKALRENGFAVPEPISQNRHTIVMSLIDAFPLRQITEVPDPAGLYAELIEMIMRLASFGLIHGDFNEFNILIREDLVTEESPQQAELQDTDLVGKNVPSNEAVRLTPILIDFPQMVSLSHPNAPMYFDRDVSCIKKFFSRRFGFTSDNAGPSFEDAKRAVSKSSAKRLDVEVEASGFSKKMAKELEVYMAEVGVDGDGGEALGSDGETGSDEHEDDEETRLEIEAKFKIEGQDNRLRNDGHQYNEAKPNSTTQEPDLGI